MGNMSTIWSIWYYVCFAAKVAAFGFMVAFLSVILAGFTNELAGWALAWIATSYGCWMYDWCDREAQQYRYCYADTHPSF